jgi:Tol biopolymer transport system component
MRTFKLRLPARVATVTALAVTAGLLVVPPSSAESPAPAVSFRTDDGFATASRGGAVLYRSGPNDAQFWSTDHKTLAYSRVTPDSEEIVVQDAASGRVLSRIPDGFGPVVADGGRQIAFMPDRNGKRDPYVNSVWIRNRDGATRKVVQFSSGPGTPGLDIGMNGDNRVIAYGLDAKARTMVVTAGNDIDLFRYDSWVIDMATGKAVRVTTGESSRWATLSAEGDRVAYVRETAYCGGEGPGYRAGNIELVMRDGSGRRVLLGGNCGQYYTDPRWLSGHELALARLVRTAEGGYDVDVAVLDTRTGSTRIVARDITYFTASTTNRTLAWMQNGMPGFTMLRPGGRAVHVPEGVVPELNGERAF